MKRSRLYPASAARNRVLNWGVTFCGQDNLLRDVFKILGIFIELKYTQEVLINKNLSYINVERNGHFVKMLTILLTKALSERQLDDMQSIFGIACAKERLFRLFARET